MEMGEEKEGGTLLTMDCFQAPQESQLPEAERSDRERCSTGSDPVRITDSADVADDAEVGMSTGDVGEDTLMPGVASEAAPESSESESPSLAVSALLRLKAGGCVLDTPPEDASTEVDLVEPDRDDPALADRETKCKE